MATTKTVTTVSICATAEEAYLEVDGWHVEAIKASLADERPNTPHADVVARRRAAAKSLAAERSAKNLAAEHSAENLAAEHSAKK